jgi:hypothetical protein
LARSSALPKSAHEPVKDSLLVLKRWSFLRSNNGHAAGHTCDERHVSRDLLDLDPHRNSLRKPNPREDRVNVGQALGAACGIRGTDTACDALDLAPERAVIAKQCRFDGITDMDVDELRLLEIGID